jgi:hypothetical protein
VEAEEITIGQANEDDVLLKEMVNSASSEMPNGFTSLKMGQILTELF